MRVTQLTRIHNPNLKSFATRLRVNMTKEEKKLWYQFLKHLPLTFYRQKIFGNYIADFYCASKKLIIELDGSQHFEDKGIEYDKIRDEYLSSLGLTVLRISNYEINRNFQGVCDYLLVKLGLN